MSNDRGNTLDVSRNSDGDITMCGLNVKYLSCYKNDGGNIEEWKKVN